MLLPDDERLLADQWLLTQRSVHEIEAVSSGVGFTARDVRTGERVEVREGTASHTLKMGELICARLVPAGDTIQLFGGFETVTLRERDDLVAALGDEAEPGELVLCSATLRSEDPNGLAAQEATGRNSRGRPRSREAAGSWAAPRCGVRSSFC